jgi:hypothetical protein
MHTSGLSNEGLFYLLQLIWKGLVIGVTALVQIKPWLAWRALRTQVRAIAVNTHGLRLGGRND